MRLRDDVLVLHRHHRDVEPDHGAGPAREIAGRRDHVLAGDVALVGLHQPLAGSRPLDRGDHRRAVDLRTQRPRALGESLGQVGGLDIPVVGVLDGAEDAVGLAERPDFLELRRSQHVHLHADRAGDAGVVHVLVPAVLGSRQADVRHPLEADRLAGLRFEPAVKPHRIFVNLPDGIAHVEERQQPGGMPGRAGGQLLPLDQHDIRPALLGQVVERRHADDAAADDHRTRVTSHSGFCRLKRPR